MTVSKKVFMLLAAVIIFLAFFSFKDPEATVAGELDTMSGWLWSSNGGWISLNDSNCTIDNCEVYGIEYGATVRSGGNLIGAAWSENLGWICFGETCADWGTGNAPDGVAPTAGFDGIKFSGWANIKALGNEGWFKLQGPAVSAEGKTGASCFNCYYSGGTKCRACFTEISEQNYGLIGDVCYNCSQCATSSLPFLCGECSNCNKYGMMVDYDNNQIFGWAWGGFDNNKGVGWIKAYEENAVYSPLAWLETKYGNVYSQKEISASPAPPGRYNATYCIQSSGILTSFNTENGCELTVAPGYEKILFPDQNNLYTNELGNIDIDGILGGLYGEIEEIEQSNAKTKHITNNKDDDDRQELELGGKIYHIHGNLTINKELVFDNTSNGNASGLIFVDGDLNISKDIYYESAGVDKMKDLASVGWIIKGNLVIAPDVEQVVGAFYVEGEDGISTGKSGKALTIYGLWIAKRYVFGREYESIDRGSEQIIYDGRALVNTPPGMKDLTKSLPLYKEAAP